MNFFAIRLNTTDFRKFSFPLVTLLLTLAGMGAGRAQLSIMSLGDSITKGGGAGDDGTDASGYYLQSGYRSELYTDLLADHVSFNFEGANTYHATAVLTAAGDQYENGYGSYTLNDIYQNLAGTTTSSTPEGGDNNEGGYWMTGGHGTGRSALSPNIVLLLGGTNDINVGDNLATMESDMAENLNWFAANRPNSELIVGTVLPFIGAAGTTQINTQISAFNLWLKNTELLAFSNYKLVDLNALFTANESTFFSTDGVHPDAVGYNAMGDAFASAIVASAPEPSSVYLLMTGLAGCALVSRRRTLFKKSR